jgi:diphthine synthase
MVVHCTFGGICGAAQVHPLHSYTSILQSSKEELEEFYGRPLILADREQVESFAHQILKGADTEDVALLVVGDPFAYVRI